VVSALAPILEGFFTEHLGGRRASPATVASYRDTFRLLLHFAQVHIGTPPSRLDLAQLDAPMIGAFLDHLEADRGNGVVTRNLRLTAIHSLFRYAALRCPEHAGLIQRVLAMPNKRRDVHEVTFLTADEIDALLAAPDRSDPLGRRDYLLLAFAVHTGLRVSELTAVRCGDIAFGVGAHVRCIGKGRRERCTPITKQLARLLADWIRDRQASQDDPLFTARSGGQLASDTVADLLDKHLAIAAENCASLRGKHVTPHTLRHTCAMNLLHAGVDTSSIALWLGHATSRSTQPYLHADMKLKERALARVAPTVTAGPRYRPPDRLLAFLEGL
jgi:integrase/recombinase XerD